MKGQMRIMGTNGDTRLIWDSDRSEEVENARRTFKDLKAKKYRAFSVKKGGDKGEIVEEFDPDMEKIIMVPPLAGG